MVKMNFSQRILEEIIKSVPFPVCVIQGIS